VTVSAGNTPPVAKIIQPLAGTKWSVGDTIRFAGTGTDAEDGTLPAAQMSWSLIMYHWPVLTMVSVLSRAAAHRHRRPERRDQHRASTQYAGADLHHRPAGSAAGRRTVIVKSVNANHL
jgi:hypothetical protein